MTPRPLTLSELLRVLDKHTPSITIAPWTYRVQLQASTSAVGLNLEAEEPPRLLAQPDGSIIRETVLRLREPVGFVPPSLEQPPSPKPLGRTPAVGIMQQILNEMVRMYGEKLLPRKADVLWTQLRAFAVEHFGELAPSRETIEDYLHHARRDLLAGRQLKRAEDYRRKRPKAPSKSP